MIILEHKATKRTNNLQHVTAGKSNHTYQMHFETAVRHYERFTKGETVEQVALLKLRYALNYLKAQW